MDRPLAIAPRVLAPILRDLRASDVVPGAPADLTLADLDRDTTASLQPDVVRELRRAVAARVQTHRHRIASVEPFAHGPRRFELEDLGLSRRTYNAMSRFPLTWLHIATIEDVLATPQLGATGLVEMLAAYEAFSEGYPSASRPTDAPPAEAAQRLEAEEKAPEADPPPRRPPPQRVLDMVELYDTGATLEEVGNAFGVTRERIRQLFLAHDVPVRSIGETHALRREQLADDRRNEIYELVDSGLAPNQIAARLKVSRQLVRDVIADDPNRSRLAAFRRNAKIRSRPRYSDEEIIECLRTANVELGGILTTADYTDYARTRKLPDGRPWPLSQTPGLRFGSWREALLKAGLEANPPSAVAGQRLFTREHCVDAILEVERELGHPPTAAEYERAAVASRGFLPSLATVRNRCGGWQTALALAVRFSQ